MSVPVDVGKTRSRIPIGLIFILALAFTALISGGLVNRYYEGEVASLEERLADASDSIAGVREQERQKRVGLESRVGWLELEKQALLREMALSRSKRDSLVRAGIDVLNVYGLDDLHRWTIVKYHVLVSSDATLLGKLTELSKFLSKVHFYNAPIEVGEIDQRDTLLVAVIDLEEPPPPSEPKWDGFIFSFGSAGGQLIDESLTATFLQRDYSGKWIDAVEFHYDGRPFPSDRWDHAPLHGIRYRCDPAVIPR